MLTSQHKELIKKGYQCLKSQNPSFKPRKSQNELVASIAKCIAGDIDDNNRILLVESGTGTGKSLAYLLSGIPLALRLKKKLIISTATIALQQQLLKQELPKIHRAYEGNFKFTLAKGRQRYCCQHKLKRLTLHPDQHQDSLQIASLWQALKHNQWEGDRESWPEDIPDRIWTQIQSDGFSCNPQQTRHRHCPFAKARQVMQKSQVIIVNHSLLLADLDHGGGVILPEPEECIYIIDEAHLLPEITRNASLCKIELKYLQAQLQELKHFIATVNQKITTGGFISTRLQCLDSIADLDHLSRRLHDYAAQQSEHFIDGILRFAFKQVPKYITDLAANYQPSTQKLYNALEQLAGQIQETADEGKLAAAIAETWLTQTGQFQHIVEQLLNTLYFYTQAIEGSSNAYWIEGSEKQPSLCASPIFVGPKLKAIFWERAFSAILVSATLSALGKFDYFIHEAGLFNLLSRSQQLKNASPFNYHQVSLRLTRQLVPPEDPDFSAQVARYIIQNRSASMAMMVLCTSYRLVDELCQQLEKQKDISLFVQGHQPTAALLASYRESIDKQCPSVLIATTGFGEGIDLPGHYLTHLVIPRLPFAVPSDPVIQTHNELLEQKGLNGFTQLTLPYASRKLIQYCGRLMRKDTDSGIIAILDQRMLTRRYGQQLLNSLPDYKIEYIDD
ncbi:ATP-dependent DNA helicase DinG [Celerinatantimonas sp. YJH-8]|uniref:ATP-dependent DNA helicase DinG n=1 Tax=Celerinatantimonas sp. YJH-8 TaxID=3228714 RepID=UPI0038BF22B4